MYEIFDNALTELVNYAIVGFEFVGVVVLIISGLKGIVNYVKRSPQIRLTLAEGMALSLEFKLGSEILRTVIVRQLSELVFVAGIILLRAALTYLIHWEIDYEERQKRDAVKARDQKLKTEELEVRKEEAENCSEDYGHETADEAKSGIADKILGARFGAEEEKLREKARKKYDDSSK